MSLAASRIGLILIGYCTAVLMAVATVVAILFLTNLLPGEDFLAGLWRAVRQIPQTFLIGVMIIFPTALPGFVCVLVLAAAARWRGWLVCTLAGGLNCIPAFMLLNVYVGTAPLTIPAELLALGFAGGLVGGHSFWRVSRPGKVAA